jgi:CRISPR-associated protein (TIGR03985 family)
MESTFEYSPTVPLLSHLLQGKGLKNPINLGKAIRLWVLLRCIYGHESDPIYCHLNESFTYPEWRDAFFLEQKLFHQNFNTDSLEHSNSQCPCYKSIHQWLFADYLATDQQQWYEDFRETCYLAGDADIKDFLDTLSWEKSKSNDDKNRLFACVPRTINNNLKELVKLGYLEKISDKFHKLEEIDFSPLAQSKPVDAKFNFPNLSYIRQEDLSEVPDLFRAAMGQKQRFFMHVDYVVAKRDLDNDWPYRFQQLWQENEFPILRLEYDSVSLHRLVKRITYPVCIYYYQRALYLCAYGQDPKDRNKLDWYNYRLDRIKAMANLDWSDPEIPLLLREQYHQQNLFTADYIDTQLSRGFGFDFYKPLKTMVLRFNQDFSERYIDESFRHETFEKFDTVRQLSTWLGQQQLQPAEKEQLQRAVKQWQAQGKQEPTHSYFRMDYRHQDNNVIMRLRAWGPNVEVLFPLDLRQRMALDVQAMADLYSH